jgi:hypothetical protein
VEKFETAHSGENGYIAPERIGFAELTTPQRDRLDATAREALSRYPGFLSGHFGLRVRTEDWRSTNYGVC